MDKKQVFELNQKNKYGHMVKRWFPLRSAISGMALMMVYLT